MNNKIVLNDNCEIYKNFLENIELEFNSNQKI